MSLIPDDYFSVLSRIESGGRAYMKAPTSSASGLYQFIRGTWTGLGGEWGSDPNAAFGGLKPSIAEQDRIATLFTIQNAGFLQNNGITVNNASLYAAHFLGAGTASKVLGASPSAQMSELVGAGVIKANPFMQNMTVGGFFDWLKKKTGASVDTGSNFPCPHCGQPLRLVRA